MAVRLEVATGVMLWLLGACRAREQELLRPRLAGMFMFDQADSPAHLPCRPEWDAESYPLRSAFTWTPVSAAADTRGRRTLLES